MTVRSAAPYDYDALCALIKEIDDYHRVAEPHFFREHLGVPRPLQWLMDILANPEMTLLVAERDDKIVGFLWGILRSAPDTPFHVPRRYMLVDMLGVTEAYRGQGIGSALMAHAEQWAKAKGATEVELAVWEFNKSAQAMYRKVGYKTTMQRLWKSLAEWRHEQNRLSDD
jgi:diamine N-acetyltransferase